MKMNEIACAGVLLAGTLSVSGLSAAVEVPRWMTIMPLAESNQQAIADDVRSLKATTVIDSVAWCCTLVPEGGEPPVDQAAVYAERYGKMHELLKGSGVKEGILFQATVGHGWTPGKPTSWQKMIRRDGSSLYKFCPLGAEFRAYIAGQAKTLAALRPDFFMVDDDTRYICGIDGCFCPMHLAGFAKRHGHAENHWTRETLAAELAKDSALAEDWDRYLEDTMVPLMETIRAAFPKEIPGEFCCCQDDSHHASRMAKALAAPGQRPVVRINNALYLQDGMRNCFLERWGRTSWEINDLEPGTIVLDEADTCPQTRYSMDATRLVHHIAMNTLSGCDGAKIWITRLGNAHETESGRAYRELFAKKRGWMEEVAKLALNRSGVVIPQPSNRPRTLRPWRIFDWGTRIFGCMGIPYRYRRPEKGQLTALNGELVHFLSDDDLKICLAGPCLLDGSAAEELTKRGFGKLIGVEAKRWVGATINVEKFATETLNCTVAAAADLSAADPKAVAMSRYLNRKSGMSSETTDVGAGSLWFENELGGKIAIVAAHLAPRHDLHHIEFYGETRKRELSRILAKLGNGKVPGGAMYKGDAELVAVTGTAADGRSVLVLDNLGLDDVTKPEFAFDELPVRILRLGDDGSWQPVEFSDGRPEVTLRTYRPEVLVLERPAAAAGSGNGLRLDFETKLGAVKPLHQAGQPPQCGWDYPMFKLLPEAGIRYSRLHDTGGAFGGGRFVDITNLFRDFEADETLTNSYDFAFTDKLLAAMVKNGIKPFFRLGETIENFAYVRRYRTFVPPDKAKWARICEHVIRHYNEGWANGYHYGIEYWEIWNEPDFTTEAWHPMWSGTKEDFYELYEAAATHLKKCFPNLKIGGYGSCGFWAITSAEKARREGKDERTEERRAQEEFHVEFFRGFLRRVKAKKIPFDFFTFHSYSPVDDMLRQIEWCCDTMKSEGFGNVELNLDEWLPAPKHDKLGTARQAAEIAAVIAGATRTRLDMAMIYDARCGVGDYSPLFNPLDYKTHLAYDVFAMYDRLFQAGELVKVDDDRQAGLYTAAAIGRDGHGWLFAANTGDKPVELPRPGEGWKPVSCRSVAAGASGRGTVAFEGVIRPEQVLLVEYVKEN